MIDILPSMLVFGLGAGLGFPAIVTLAMRDVEMQDTGLASGLVNTSAQVGGAIGLAVLATLAAERTDAVRATAESADAALNAGYHLAYVVGAILVGAAIAVACASCGPRRRRRASRRPKRPTPTRPEPRPDLLRPADRPLVRRAVAARRA